MHIAVLTSSRADYGIYLPLLKKLNSDPFFNLTIIAFGTHLSRLHGYTIQNILDDGFEVSEKLETLILGDTEAAISNAIGNTVTRFSNLWSRISSKIDIVFALGDRYEMFAAVAASVPFNIKIAHIHGGETTLGAIDNKFRHAISLMSTLHFASTDEYCERIKNLIGSDRNIFKIGALSLDNLSELQILSVNDFQEKYDIDLSIPTVLVTFHPETVNTEKNGFYALELVKTFNILSKKKQIVITLPNSDTFGSIIRSQFLELANKNGMIHCVENFGSIGYFSCMSYCSFMIGNTSSGIIEAASLGKFVINLGNRQAGRIRSHNVIDTEIDCTEILNTINRIADFEYKGTNVYYVSNSASAIVTALKQIDSDQVE